MSRVGNPPLPFRWAVGGRRQTWHALLPAGDGAYRLALCGWAPARGWRLMFESPPRLGRLHTCNLCRTYVRREGGPSY